MADRAETTTFLTRRITSTRRPLIAIAFAIVVPLAAASVTLPQQAIEGTVASAKLTACDPKPGGCEGSLVLEPKGVASGPVTIKIRKGTVIKHGDGHLLLPATKGSVVAITYVEERGEKVAKSIEVKDVKR